MTMLMRYPVQNLADHGLDHLPITGEEYKKNVSNRTFGIFLVLMN